MEAPSVRERQRLVELHVHFAKREAARLWQQKAYRRGRFEDLLQAAYLGLCEAALRFDKSRKVRFISFAGYWIKRCIQDEVLSAGVVNTPAQSLRGQAHRLAPLTALAARAAWACSSLDGWVDDEDDEHPRLQARPFARDAEPGYYPDDDDEREQLNHLLEQLSPRGRAVVVLRYGQGLTLAATGKSMGMSRERIRQIEATALARLRRACLDGVHGTASRVAVAEVVNAWLAGVTAATVVLKEERVPQEA